MSGAKILASTPVQSGASTPYDHPQNMLAGSDCSVPDSRVPIILIGPVFIVLDDGALVASDYPIMERVVVHESRRRAAKLACVTIVPATAKPPDEDNRVAIRKTLATVTPHLTSLCWTLEGSGFKGAAARAVLSGILLVMNPPFPTHITGDLHDALSWSLGRASAGKALDLESIVQRIRELRPTVERTNRKNEPLSTR
jgi:hypothetical protein